MKPTNINSNNRLHIIVAITTFFIITRIILIGSLSFIKSGPLSPDNNSSHREATHWAQINIRKPIDTIYIVANSKSPQKVDVLINKTKIKTLEINPFIQEYILDVDTSLLKPSNILEFRQTLGKKESFNIPWQLWVIRTNSTGTSNLIFNEQDMVGFSQITVEDNRNKDLNYLKESLFKWDAGWYYNLLENGYQFDGNFKRQQNVGFLCFYPGMAFLLKMMTRLESTTALIVTNNLLFFLSLFLIYYISLKVIKDPYWSLLPILLLLVHPFEIFLISGYSEGCFIFFSALCLIYLYQRKYLYFALIGGILAGIRTVGIILPVLLILDYYLLEGNKLDFKNACYCLILSIISIWGFLAQMAYMFWVYQNPFVYMKIQNQAWIIENQTIGSYLIHNIKEICFHLDITNPDQTGFIIFYGFIVLCLYYLISCRKTFTRFENLLILYSFFILITPLISRFYFIYSMGRYTLVAYPLFIILSKYINRTKVLFLCSWIFMSIFLSLIYAMRFSYWHTPF